MLKGKALHGARHDLNGLAEEVSVGTCLSIVDCVAFQTACIFLNV